MAQFRTTADIVDSVLQRANEVTNGNSAFESRALEFVNRVHRTIIVGGHEFDMDINEPWVWAQAKYPHVLELKPKYDTGTVSLTNGSESGTFSAAPTDSLAGWYLKIDNELGIFRIATHTAGGTAFELDGDYDGDTGATLNFKAFKLDYEIEPTHIVIDSSNNKLDFEETAASQLTATLTAGSYSPSELASHVKTQLDAAGASTYTVSYSSLTKKFTISSDLGGGGGTFKLLCQSGTNQSVSAWGVLGFDIEDQATAASHTSIYRLGGIARLVDPIVIYKKYQFVSNIYGIDRNRFQKEYPPARVSEGYPTRFTVIQETNDGGFTIRFDKYPIEATRIEIPYIPVPVDLKDNAQSVPIIPRKYIDVVEYGAAAEILFEKEDSKWEGYFTKARAKLMAMMTQNRNDSLRIGKNFGQIIARTDKLLSKRRKYLYGPLEDE